MRSVFASAKNLTRPSVSSKWLVSIITYNTIDLLTIGPCSSIGLKREFSNFELDLLVFELFFSVTDPRDFRVRVNDGRNGLVVYVAWSAREGLNHRNAFFARFVRQHRAFDDIANRVNVRQCGAELFVGLNSTSRVCFDAKFLERVKR